MVEAAVETTLFDSQTELDNVDLIKVLQRLSDEKLLDLVAQTAQEETQTIAPLEQHVLLGNGIQSELLAFLDARRLIRAAIIWEAKIRGLIPGDESISDVGLLVQSAVFAKKKN